MSNFSSSGVDVDSEFYGRRCLSDEALRLYAIMHFSNIRGNPIDLTLKEIRGLDGFEERDIKEIYEICVGHVNKCDDCSVKLARHCGNLLDRVKTFERHVEEHLRDMEKTMLFFELRRNLLKEHINFDDSNGLFRYFEGYFFSFNGFQPVTRYEEHIKECWGCQKYKELGHLAELW